MGTGYPGQQVGANYDPIELERAHVRAGALSLRIEFQAKHPGFRFRLPWETQSGGWEVETPTDGVLAYDHAVSMMHDLMKRYPE